MAGAFYVRFEDGTQYGPAPIEQVVQWAREGRLRRPSMLAPADDSSPPMPAASHPMLAPILRAPPTIAGPLPAPEGSALIPARNPPALIGYYTAVFSLVPLFALLLGPIAIGLGIAGWKKYRREPRVKGAAHAWVAIIVGTLTSLVNWGAAILTLIAVLTHR
jgi:hypothetical protein